MRNKTITLSKTYRKNKTEPKQPSHFLPELINPKKQISIVCDMREPSKQKRKLSEREANQFNKKWLIKKLTHQVSSDYIIHLKNAVKLTKNQSNNSCIKVKRLTSPSETFNLENIVNLIGFEADQIIGSRASNQDRICCKPETKMRGQTYSFFGIFDGHGTSSVSQYLRVNLYRIFVKNLKQNEDIKKALSISLKEAEQKVNELYKTKNFKGGSCVSVLVLHRNRYYIAHLGDSRILKVEKQVEQLTEDHRPQNQHERRRIEQFGGRIYRQHDDKDQQSLKPYRVYPGGLTVTRAIGDTGIKNHENGGFLSSKPQLISGDIKSQTLFVLVTDGATEKFSNQEICGYFRKEKPMLKKCVETFLMNCILRESNDNISLISVLAMKK